MYICMVLVKVSEALIHATERPLLCGHLRSSRRHRPTRSRLQLARKHLLLRLPRHGNSKRMADDQGAGREIHRRVSRPLGNHSVSHVGLSQLRWVSNCAVLLGYFRGRRASLHDAAQPDVVSERGATAKDCVLVQYVRWRVWWYSVVRDWWY
jgi:hypothetical protein